MSCPRIIALMVVVPLLVMMAQAQQQSSPGAPAADHPESEIATQDLDNAIKVQVNLVLVRAVVTDAGGKLVPNLKQADFKIWDNGKPRSISSFSVETQEASEKKPASAATPAPQSGEKALTQAGAPSAPAMPQRFVVLVLDDLHLKVADALAVHAAMEKLFTEVRPSDRVAIYSTEGDIQQDFTGDAAILRKLLASAVPHPPHDEAHSDCPNMNYYQADLIWNRHDQEATAAAQADALINNCPANLQFAAQRILQETDGQTRATYRYLDDIVRKLSGMPGQRVLVYVSPGYIVGNDVLSDSSEWIERAIRAGVVANTIDARGLYTPDALGDIAASPQAAPWKHLVNGVLVSDPTIDYQGIEGTYRTQQQFDSGQVLASMAASTGGTYFHNRNDLDVGVTRAIAEPSVSYVLGFRPQDPADGKFHNLKVELVGGTKYQIQARNGYFAPKKLADPEAQAKLEVNEMLFSQDEIVSIPVQLKTEFFRTDDTFAQLTVLTHLDTAGIRFRKVDDRSSDDLVLATGVFDSNGQFISGQMKEVTLKLKSSTLERVSETGLTFKTVFTVKPGTYFLRSVVRGSEGQQLTARNLTTVVP